MNEILWKCRECDGMNTYPQDTECQTCGERMTPAQKEEVKRVEFLIRRAESNDLYAAVDLYEVYKKGDKVVRNKKEALRWLEYAAQKNLANAQLEMGVLYYFENDLVKRDDAQAFKWFDKARENNSPFAAGYMAQFYYNGLGIAEDKQKAFELYLESAKQGVPESMERTAMCYMYGEGVESDEEKAFYWLNRATEVSGHELRPGAAFLLGRLLFDEEIEEKNENSRALHYLEIAYKGGYPLAGCLIGQLYYNFGSPETIKKAKEIWTDVTKKSDKEASDRAQEFLRMTMS